MNIEHLKEGQEIKCIKDTSVDFKYGSWYKLFRLDEHGRLSIGGWTIIGDETDCEHFDLANPRTPIDNDAMRKFIERVSQFHPDGSPLILIKEARELLSQSKLD